MHRLLLRLSLLAALFTAPAAADLFRTNLFTAGQGGYAMYRIPGILVTTRGTLLAWCEARRDGAADWGWIDLLLRRSSDGGATWSAPQLLSQLPAPTPRNPVAPKPANDDPAGRTMNNPVMIADRDGTVHFLFCGEYHRAYYARSRDDGLTFGPARDITAVFEAFRPDYDWKVIATGPGHAIQLRNGRLVVPVWLSDSSRGAHHPSCVATIFSDDGGETWRRGEIIANTPESLADPSEAALAELADGRVLLNLRSESPAHRRAVAFSRDGATGWTRPAFDDALFEPVCMAGLIRLPGHPRERQATLLFSHPDSGAFAEAGHPRSFRQRRNLTIRLSADDGATWPVKRVLDSGISAYSDLAAGPDGALWCFYESGGSPGTTGRLGALTLARFDLDWLFGEDTRTAADGFVDLFNGRDLSGWVNVNCAPGTWTATNGVIACTGAPIGELRTDRMYQNFILELEWRHLKPEGNAGVFVWADALTARGQPFIRGVEVQVLDGRESDWFTSDGDVFPIHGAKLSPLNGRGGDRAFPVTRRAKPSPGWNHYRITCVDGVLTHAVNGRVVTRGVGATPRKGYLCLESEGSPAEFRNLRVKELPATTALAPEDIATPDEHFRPLYNGVDLTGWNAAAEAALPWRPDDWTLTSAGTNAPPLLSQEMVGDGELIFDWRWTDESQRGDWTKLFRLRRHDLSAVLNNPAAQAAELKPGQWNRARLTLRGNRLSVLLNGQSVVQEANIEDLPATGAIELRASPGPAQLANLFWRRLD